MTPREVMERFKNYLNDRVDRVGLDGQGGCETCGFGATVVVEWENLMQEIDKFSKTFQDKP